MLTSLRNFQNEKEHEVYHCNTNNALLNFSRIRLRKEKMKILWKNLINFNNLCFYWRRSNFKISELRSLEAHISLFSNFALS